MKPRGRAHTSGARRLGVRMLAPVGQHQEGDTLVLSPMAIVVTVIWMAFAMNCAVGGKHVRVQKDQDVPQPNGASVVQTPLVTTDAAASTCLIAGPQGPWGHYQMRDLPRGNCSSAQTCMVWTKDSCPGTDAPGPGIKWQCVCDSGTWRCDEQARTKTVCVPP